MLCTYRSADVKDRNVGVIMTSTKENSSTQHHMDIRPTRTTHRHRDSSLSCLDDLNGTLSELNRGGSLSGAITFTLSKL